MVSKLTWADPESEAILLTTELNNLVDGTLAVDAGSYDNETNKYRWANFMFFGTFDAPLAAGGLAELHIFYTMDGTLYGDGEAGDAATPEESSNSKHGIFLFPGTPTAVYQQILYVPLMPFEFKAGIVCDASEDLTAVDTHTLKMYPFNEESA